MRFQEKLHCDQRVRGDQRGYHDDLHIGFQQGTYLVHGGDVPKSIVVVSSHSSSSRRISSRFSSTR